MTCKEQLIELLETGGKIATDKMHKDICEAVKKNHKYSSKENKTSSLTEIIADYLLNNGVTVLPCKVGDTVYFIKSLFSFMPAPKAEKIRKVEIIEGEMIFRTETRTFNEKAINDTVFFEKESTEKALREREING